MSLYPDKHESWVQGEESALSVPHYLHTGWRQSAMLCGALRKCCSQWLILPAGESGNEGSTKLEQHTYVVLKYTREWEGGRGRRGERWETQRRERDVGKSQELWRHPLVCRQEQILWAKNTKNNPWTCSNQSPWLWYNKKKIQITDNVKAKTGRDIVSLSRHWDYTIPGKAMCYLE